MLESLWEEYCRAVRVFQDCPSELAEARVIKRYRLYLAEFLPLLDPTQDLDNLRAQCRRARGA